VIDTRTILANVKAVAPPNVADLHLRRGLRRGYRAARPPFTRSISLRGTYVRPEERIDDEVSALYAKISAPVLTDLLLDFGRGHGG
jgi:hypothetical protein